MPGKAQSFREVDVSGVVDDSDVSSDSPEDLAEDPDKKSQAEANVYEAA